MADLTKSQAFVLEWLSKEDSSALGECDGAELRALIDLGLAEIGPAVPEAEGYRRVWLTAAGWSEAVERRAAAPAPATGGVTEGMVDMALDAADYIPNEDNRKWMSLALAAALRSRPTVSPPPVPGEVEALRNALIAVRPIVNSLIEREHNIEWWGLRQRLAAIDAALRASPPASPTEAGEATTSLPDPALTDAIEWLETNQRQLDQDGIEVAVSRQALEQILAALKDRSHV